MESQRSSESCSIDGIFRADRRGFVWSVITIFLVTGIHKVVETISMRFPVPEERLFTWEYFGDWIGISLIVIPFAVIYTYAFWNFVVTKILKVPRITIMQALYIAAVLSIFCG